MSHWGKRSARSLVAIAATIATALAALPSSWAGATLATGFGGPLGYGTEQLPPADDTSSAAIDLTSAFPGGLALYDGAATGAYVNNNGNISLAAPLPTLTPGAFPLPTGARAIAPYFGDVDTRVAAPSGSVVYFGLAPGALVATWYEVGYYTSHVDLLNSFQVILTAASDPGDFDVEFRYARCEWTTGDAAGGMGGLGGSPAAAGINAGDGVRSLSMPGSATAAVLDLCNGSNVADPGVWRLRVRGGVPSLCGNGVREGVEECDGYDVPPGTTCYADCTVTAPNGAACTVGAACGSGFCTDGVCCDFACDAEQCQACAAALGAVADGVCTNLTGPVCDDGSACTSVDTCQAGLCVGVDEVACEPVDDCHEPGACAPATGTCGAGAARPDGTSCNAGAGVCTTGVCEMPGGGGNGDGDDDGGGCAAEPHPSGRASLLLGVMALAALFVMRRRLGPRQ